MDYCGFVIRRERMARGWSQQGLCKGVCAVSYLSKIEQGQAAPSREVLDALYARLNLPVLREPQRRDAEQRIRQGMEALLDGRWDDVRHDLDMALDRVAPERQPFYRHTLEGDDDMPAHVKASLVGPSVTVPIAGGRLCLGTWQGIYLCEFRRQGGCRRLVLTVIE